MKRGKNDFYEVPRLWAIHRVPHEPKMEPMVWGRRWMIQFLIALEREWMEKWMFSQREYSNDFAKIPLGDISQNGGGPLRNSDEKHPDHRFAGHLSHRDGVDVDIHYIGTDNIPSDNRHPKLAGYDAERTKSLGFAILKAGGKHIERIFLAVDDPELVRAMKQRAVAIHPGIKWHADGIHNNHFHVRLVAKDPTR